MVGALSPPHTAAVDTPGCSASFGIATFSSTVNFRHCRFSDISAFRQHRKTTYPSSFARGATV